MKYYFVILILLPIIFPILALLAVKLIAFLARFLNDISPRNIWLNKIIVFMNLNGLVINLK
jgi:hypothetical protein